MEKKASIVAVDAENRAVWEMLCRKLWPDHDGGFSEDCASQESFLYVADGRYAGFINLSLRNDYVEGTSSSPVGYIEGIYVEADCRGTGIAREMVEFARRWTRGQGLTELASDVEAHNEASIAFHKAVGFAEANRIVCFVDKV